MLQVLKNYLLQAGLEACESSFERNTVSIFNIVNCCLLISFHISLLAEFIGQNPKGIVFSILFIGVMHFVIWLNRLGYYDIASILLCVTLPGGVFLLALGYSNVMFIDFYFVVFFLTIIIFIRNRLLRLLFCGFYFGMYTWLEFLHKDRSPLFGFEFDMVSNTMVFLIFVLLFWTLTHLLMTRFKYADGQKDTALVELQQTNTELEIATENMERLNAMASHDLKTPIRNIKSMIGLISKKSNDANIAPLINDIDGLASNMINLIDQTIEHGKLKHLCTDNSIMCMDRSLDHIVSLIGSRFGEFELKRGPYIPFSCNSIGLLKVLQNLIENAAKYNTSENKVISVTQEVKGQRMLIRVTDNGIGIDQKYRSQVFGMYTRLHTTSDFPGTGLGLAICKRIIDQMDGTITVSANENGTGSTFVLDLPYIPSQEAMPSHSLSMSRTS